MNRSLKIVAFVLVTFFVISVITGVMGPIFPSLKEDFQISNTVTSFFPFAFFIAYGVMSIPAGLMVERHGEKTMVSSALAIATLGSLVFVQFPSFSIAIISLFCIGSAMAILQVVINPLLRVAGGEEHYAFYSVLGQCLFAVGGIVAPQVYSNFVLSLSTKDDQNLVFSLLGDKVPEAMPWLSVYWLFAVLLMLLLVVLYFLKLPKVELKDDEKVASFELCLQLLKDKTVLLFFFGIMAYVGTEIGITTSISLFLQQYHQFDPVTDGANAITSFWSAMTVGCFVGLGLMKIADSKKVLFIFTLAAIVSYLVAIFSKNQTTLFGYNLTIFSYSSTGFFLSVMYPAIFSLGLNSMKKHHGTVAGILCTGIVGGALVPPMIGLIADLSGSYRAGVLFVLIPLIYIAYLSLKAKPLVANKKIKIFST